VSTPEGDAAVRLFFRNSGTAIASSATMRVLPWLLLGLLLACADEGPHFPAGSPPTDVPTGQSGQLPGGDAGVVRDGGPSGDGGTGGDGGGLLDAGGLRDGGVPLDGGGLRDGAPLFDSGQTP
jgi:hypothetical protein